MCYSLAEKLAYELRVHGGSGASAEIIQVKNRVCTVIAKTTVPANYASTLLRWKPLEDKPSLIQRIKPSKIKVNLAIVGFEWNLDR